MDVYKKKISKSLLITFFLLIIILLFYFFEYQYTKNREIPLKSVAVNLLTSVHPSLNWSFKPLKPKLLIKPGEVTTVEYMVENYGNKETTGIATFVYFPKQFGNYISKINCFCYDAQTLKPKQKNKFILVLLIDPEVTKDSKTKDIKEFTMQFTFFDYKEYKEKQS